MENFINITQPYSLSFPNKHCDICGIFMSLYAVKRDNVGKQFVHKLSQYNLSIIINNNHKLTKKLYITDSNQNTIIFITKTCPQLCRSKVV